MEISLSCQQCSFRDAYCLYCYFILLFCITIAESVSAGVTRGDCEGMEAGDLVGKRRYTQYFDERYDTTFSLQLEILSR